MKTAEEMYNYCVENGYGSGMTRNWGIKHFKVIEENLRSDEEVYMTFIGLKDFVSITNHDNNYAYAITNKRMMFGQKKLMGQNFVSVVFDRINDISSSTGMAMGTVTIDTLGETFNVGVDKATANNISKEAHNIIFDMRSDKEIIIKLARKYQLPVRNNLNLPSDIVKVYRFEPFFDSVAVESEEGLKVYLKNVIEDIKH